MIFFPFFAGYYERLITGQLDFKWSPEDADAKRPSMATITSDSTPESDSIRTSLADISHGGGNLLGVTIYQGVGARCQKIKYRIVASRNTSRLNDTPCY